MAFVLDFFFHQQAVVLLHHGIQQLVLFNQAAANGSADHAACNQAIGCRSGAQRGCTGNAKVLQHRAKSARCTVAANHRNGTGAKAHQRADPHHVGQPHRQKVLGQNQRNNQAQKHQHGFAAAFEHLQVCLEADRGKEEYHADFFQDIIKCKLHNAGHIAHAGEHGKQHAAHNGRRDAELFQQAAFFTQKLSQHQYHDRNGKGLVHIQLYDHAASSPAAMPFS